MIEPDRPLRLDASREDALIESAPITHGVRHGAVVGG